MTGIDHQPLEIRLLYHRFQHFFPDALVSPATETPLDSIPLTIFRRQVSPWCSRSQNPEHAIQKLTGILCVPSPRSLVSYCVRLENFPHRIGHIVPSIAVLHEETPLCVFLNYTTKRHFCRQCLVPFPELQEDFRSFRAGVKSLLLKKIPTRVLMLIVHDERGCSNARTDPLEKLPRNA